MSLPDNIDLREYWKFRDGHGDQETIVATAAEGSFTVPPQADAFTVELDNGDLDVVYKFYSGGTGGTLLSTVTLTYATAQTLTLTQGTIVRT